MKKILFFLIIISSVSALAQKNQSAYDKPAKTHHAEREASKNSSPQVEKFAKVYVSGDYHLEISNKSKWIGRLAKSRVVLSKYVWNTSHKMGDSYRSLRTIQTLYFSEILSKERTFEKLRDGVKGEASHMKVEANEDFIDVTYMGETIVFIK